MRRNLSRIGYPLAGIVLIVAAWVVICWFGNMPTVVLPTPDKVVRAFVGRFDILLSEGWITFKETIYGFLLAMAIGLPMAVAIANSRPLNLMFYPLLVALQSVPKGRVGANRDDLAGNRHRIEIGDRLAGRVFSDHCRHHRGSALDPEGTARTGS